jgi:TPR repeat protein
MAADKGHGFAMCEVGNLYNNGEGVTKDLAVAAYWYDKAAKQGDTEAVKTLAKLLELGVRPRAPEEEDQ